MSHTIHSVMLNAGEALLVLPAPALVSVLNPQGLLPAQSEQHPELAGAIEVDGQSVTVLAPEVLLGRPALPLHERCRIARIRPPGTRQSFGLLVRAYPLVLSLNERAFTQTDAELPAGVLAQAQVGQRQVLLPDLEQWSARARELAGMQVASTESASMGSAHQSP
jgi:hypothetical protein